MLRRKVRSVCGLSAVIAAPLLMLIPSIALLPPSGSAGTRSYSSIFDGEKPGSVLSEAPLPTALWLPDAAQAYRVVYVTTSWNERPARASGEIFVPRGTRPRGGWPIVSWAHGTVGLTDSCAPSIAGDTQRDINYLNAWLQAGYSVVATDYAGLGTPGPYPYYDGHSEAFSVIDIVRAARHVVRSLSRSWVAVGQSEGGHASLWTASLATDYAPELDFRGAVATAPAVQLLATAEIFSPFKAQDPANPGIFLLADGYQATHPGWDPAQFLTEEGIKVLRLAETTYCYNALAAWLAQQKPINGDVITDMNVMVRFAELMQYDEVPVEHYTRPVYLAQGTADQEVLPIMTEKTADELAAAGTTVTFKYYNGADHNTILTAALPDLLAWVHEQLIESP